MGCCHSGTKAEQVLSPNSVLTPKHPDAREDSVVSDRCDDRSNKPVDCSPSSSQAVRIAPVPIASVTPETYRAIDNGNVPPDVAPQIGEHLDSIDNDSREWYHLLNNDKYCGEWEGSMIHGKGVYVYTSTGYRYEGEFLNHERHGHGVFTYGNSAHCYEGEWKAGKRCGRGKYSMADGSIYTGEFDDDVFSGQGRWCGPPIPVAVDGRRAEQYEGYWLAGLRHGQGVALEADGSTYHGSFLRGRKHGSGHYTSNNGVYTGEWKEDLMDGTGQLHHRDGSIYVGAFMNGMRHGEGVLYAPEADGARYAGGWKMNRRTGEGVYYYADGKAVRGHWVDDDIEGEPEFYSKEEVETGCLLDHTPHNAGDVVGYGSDSFSIHDDDKTVSIEDVDMNRDL